MMNDSIENSRVSAFIPSLLYLYAFTICLSTSVTHGVLGLIVLVFLIEWWKSKSVGKIRKDFSLFAAIYAWKGITLIANGLIIKLYKVKDIWFKMPYLVISRFSVSRKQLLTILSVLFITNVVLVIYGIGQKFFGFPIIYKSMFVGWDLRFVGYLENPIDYAGHISIVLILCFSLSLYYKKSYSIYLPFTIVGLIMSGSRGYYISILAVILLVGYLRSLKVFIGSVIVVILTLVILTTVFPELNLRMSADAIEVSFNTRTKYWIAAWETYKEHPLFGVGYQEFFLNYILAYMDTGFITERGNAHNLYLHELVEGGPIGFFLVTFIMVYFVRKYFRYFKENNDRLLSAMGLGISISILALMIVGITEYHFESWVIWMLLTFIMGICEAYKNGLNSATLQVEAVPCRH